MISRSESHMEKRQLKPGEVSSKQIAIIIAVVVLGMSFGFFLIDRNSRRVPRKVASAGMSHVLPQSFVVRETNGMMWIPSGTFYMGSTNGPQNEQPQRLSILNGFWIDRHEVTVGEFSEFVAASSYVTGQERAGVSTSQTWRGALDGSVSEKSKNLPVTWVTWEDAKAFAKWANKRLPTEAEWEYAARGTLDRQPWPWGATALSAELANFDFGKGAQIQVVDSHPSNPLGLRDMAGNAAEWVWDWYAAPYEEPASPVNPHGPTNGLVKVVRGGSFSTPAERISTGANSFREPVDPKVARADVGFRCVRAVQ